MDGIEDIPQTKKGEYNPQDWKQVEELHEFPKVYMYSMLEQGELWTSHYSGSGIFIYKC